MSVRGVLTFVWATGWNTDNDRHRIADGPRSGSDGLWQRISRPAYLAGRASDYEFGGQEFEISSGAPALSHYLPCKIIGLVTHEVTNVGSDRSQLSRMSEQARAAIGSETIEAVADRGYYSGEEIVTCEQAGITVYLPKPMTSGLLAKGRFGKQDFVYVAADDVYLCPAGEQLTYHYTNEEEGKTLRRYWTTACQVCALKSKCTTGKERRISRWEHEAVLEAVQARLDRNPENAAKPWSIPSVR